MPHFSLLWQGIYLLRVVTGNGVERKSFVNRYFLKFFTKPTCFSKIMYICGIINPQFYCNEKEYLLCDIGVLFRVRKRAGTIRTVL